MTIPRHVAAMTMRVLAHWDTASALDLAEGLAWYNAACSLADELAERFGYSRRQTAGVIAALSPRTRWSTNASSARSMVLAAYADSVSMPRLPGYSANREKAWAILHTDDDPLTILGGPKVRAFYANILGNTDAVTVDIWAARAAEGHHFDAARAIVGRRYDDLVLAYQLAAQARGVTPREMQAAVWVTIRRVDAGALFSLDYGKEF